MAAQPENGLQAVTWNNYKTYLICIPSLRDHGLSLPDAQHLMTCFPMSCLVSQLFQVRKYPVLVTLSWTEAKSANIDFESNQIY